MIYEKYRNIDREQELLKYMNITVVPSSLFITIPLHNYWATISVLYLQFEDTIKGCGLVFDTLFENCNVYLIASKLKMIDISTK